MCSEKTRAPVSMILKAQELLQIDEAFIRHLREKDPDALATLSLKLANDLKEAMERLNQKPSNSSKPSGSLALWDKGGTDEDDAPHGLTVPVEVEGPAEGLETPDDSAEKNVPATDADVPAKRPGRQIGSQGFGRTQKLIVTAIEHHPCPACPVCQTEVRAQETAYTGFYEVNLRFGDAQAPGIQLTTTRHLYYSACCPHCGLTVRSQPHRAPGDSEEWTAVGLTEWRLIGPDLAALIVYLSMDMRLSRNQVQRFLFDLFGLKLSIGSLQNCLLESARALSPIEQQLANDLLRDSLIHADETAHPEAMHRLWLWVFVNARTALFLIGYRNKEILNNLLDSVLPRFSGWLMSDGYAVYRDHPKRLRCWTHLIRKVVGVSESYQTSARTLGDQMLRHLKHVMSAIYQAREGPDQGQRSIAEEHQATLDALRHVCETMALSTHDKTRALGREFLNDWDAIFRILEYPAWPLTNNEAERALRHWVILRKITYGTRSPQGSRALALFASVITTCRLRGHSPLLYVRDVIQLRRRGLEAPPIPAPV